MPWLVFGGIQGCREFDPTMKTIFGYAFEEFWKGFWIRVAALWLITGVALFLSIAEHLPSSYIRDCVRCCLFIYAGVVASAVAEALIACRGTDLDNDGYLCHSFMYHFTFLRVLKPSKDYTLTFLNSIPTMN